MATRVSAAATLERAPFPLNGQSIGSNSKDRRTTMMVAVTDVAITWKRRGGFRRRLPDVVCFPRGRTPVLGSGWHDGPLSFRWSWADLIGSGLHRLAWWENQCGEARRRDEDEHHSLHRIPQSRVRRPVRIDQVMLVENVHHGDDRHRGDDEDAKQDPSYPRRRHPWLPSACTVVQFSWVIWSMLH